MQFGFILFFDTIYWRRVFSALRKVKKIVNLTVRLPVRKTSFLYNIDYKVTVGKAKAIVKTGKMLKKIKTITKRTSQNTVYIFEKFSQKSRRENTFIKGPVIKYRGGVGWKKLGVGHQFLSFERGVGH